MVNNVAKADTKAVLKTLSKEDEAYTKVNVNNIDNNEAGMGISANEDKESCNIDDSVVNLPRWDRLPDISLYLEQVLELVNSSLDNYLTADKSGKILTQTMVNNYVKQGYLNPPVKKRYDKIALASLIVIATLKDIFTIREISLLIELAVNVNEPQKSYDHFCKLIEESTRSALRQTDWKPVKTLDDPKGICSAAASAFANKYYVNRVFLAEEKE